MAPKKKDSKKSDTAKAKSPLADVMSISKKVFKKDDPFVHVDTKQMKQSLPHLSTGSIVVDFAIGGEPNSNGVIPCPGFPRGKLVNLYGRPSAGKTTLALTVSASTIQGKGQVCFIDWEYAVDLNYAQSLGVPVDNSDQFALVQPETLEKGLKVLWIAAKRGIPLIVVDSVSAGVPETLYNQKLKEKGETGRVGEVARIWSVFLPQLKSTIAKTGSCVVGISQLRKTISRTGYGGSDADGTAGGESWKFYSELRLGLRSVGTEKGHVYDKLTHQMVETAVGNKIKLTIDKCKIAASQGRSAEFFIRYGKGIDDVQSVLDIATAHGIIKQSGAWYTWARSDAEDIKAQGKPALREAIENTDGAWPALYKITMDAMLSGNALTAPNPIDDDFSDIDAILSGAVDDEEG